MGDDSILSVSALTTAIRLQLEGAFPFVWVRGQVSNLARPASGHLYFSLRDEESSLSAVWFKGSQKAGEAFDPLTGEVYEDGPRPSLAHSLENGQEIVCAGKVAVYGARGVYQLLVEIVQKEGLGRLHEEFERLKAKLAGLGYFALERKRPLPPNPRRVAVITSPQGAAIQDFLRIAENRGLSASIRIFPVPVQGEAAPEKIVSALERVCREGWAELAVLIRGGGSLEDLWAFNDEALARAVYNAPLPVLAGIGHEVDFTLADMTADLRAATPTHAAQLLWPSREELLRQLENLEQSLALAESRALERVEDNLRGLARDLDWRSPQRLISGWRQSLAATLRLLQSAGRGMLEREEARLASARLALSRAPERLPLHEAAFADIKRQLDRTGKSLISSLEQTLQLEALRLGACDPHAPLERGYALVRKENGRFVKGIRDAAPGEALRLMLKDGEIPVHVDGDA